MAVIIAADSPRDWLDTQLAAWFVYYEPDVEHRIVDLGELTGGMLAELHERVTRERAPRKAAAKYLTAWFGGVIARALGFAAVGTGACFEPGDGVRWHVHPGGWAARLELGDALALVPEGHAWSGLPGTETVASEAERHARAVAALVAVARPLLDTLRPLSGLGSPGLWAEVGDGFGEALAFQSTLPVSADSLAVVRGLADAAGAPWKTQPELWPVPGDERTVCVMQKGGCCLAYTEPAADAPEDEETRLLREHVGENGGPRYCSNCSLRPAESCEAHQVWLAGR
jgi:hypothetical protein